MIAPTEHATASRDSGHSSNSSGAVAPSKKTASNMLSRQGVAQCRQTLLDKRRELLGDVEGLRHQAMSGPRSTNGPAEVSPADVSLFQSIAGRLLEHEQELLNDIELALKKIDDGVYGLCEATGQPISRSRLQIMPWARYCVAFVRAQESGTHGRWPNGGVNDK